MSVQILVHKLAKLIYPIILAVAMLAGLLLIYSRLSPVAIAAPLTTPINTDVTTDTTWAVISSPFTVTGIVRVMNGAKLTIQPGVQVRFLPNAQLRIQDNGQLMAVGTAAQTITFTSDSSTPAPGDWNGILFAANALTGTIRHAAIEYTRFGVEIDRSSSFQLYDVSSNTFRYIGGTPGVAIIGDPDFAQLSYNTIYSSDIGLQLDEAVHNQIQGNHIYDIEDDCVDFIPIGAFSSDNQFIANQIHDCGGRGISLISGPGSGGGANELISNQIWNTDGEALYAYNQNNFTFQANTVYSTALTNIATGTVVLEGMDGAEIEDNYFYNNGNPGPYEGALHVVDFSPDTFMSNIQITGNRLKDRNGSGLVFRGVNDFSGQTIHSNALCVDDRYEIENRSTNAFTLDADGNWLGTNTPTPGTEITGTVAISPHIRLSAGAVPAILPANGITPVTVTVTMNDGAGHTVPPGARQINLTTTLGTLVSTSLTLDSNGLATTTLTSASPGTATITVTEWCGYAITTTVQFVATELAIQKSSTITQVTTGQTVTYTIAYSNNSSITTTNVVITDTLPAGMIWVTDTAQSLGFTRIQTSPQVAWTIPSLNPGTNGIITLVVLWQGCAQTITNTVTITSATADSNPTNNSASYGSAGICPAILTVQKDAGVPCIAPGQTITYTITYSNSGFANADNVFLTEYKPAPTSFLPGGLNSGWVDTGGGVFTRSLGTVMAGTTYPPVYFQVQLAGQSSLSASVTAITNVVQISGGNSHTVVTSVPLVPDLVVAKNDNIGLTGASSEFATLYERVTKMPPSLTAQAEAVEPGGIIEYTIVFINNGRATATGVVLTETLPLYAQYAGGPEWVNVSGRQYVYTVGSALDPGEGGFLTFRVQITETLPLTQNLIINQVQIGGNESNQECNLGNSVSYEQTPVNRPGDLFLPILIKE